MTHASPESRLSPADDDYPHWLRAISDRPAILHVRGRLLPGRRYVACVGTRQPSAFGQAAAREISKLLAANGWSVVSGLALGVDARCHEAALEARGHTVAVLANGLDTVHPRQNTALAERILAAGGALVSEQPPGTPALPRHLVARDRIQSGMSVATIVMQTDLVGGTMHTVRYAVLQGRQLAAPVPQGAHADEPKSRGILALTRQTGTDLAHLTGASGTYRDHLVQKFAGRPVALPLTDREACAALLIQLEAWATEGAGHRAAVGPPPAQQLSLGLGP